MRRPAESLLRVVLACALSCAVGCTQPTSQQARGKKGSVKKGLGQGTAARPRKPPPELPERGPLAQRVLYQQAKGLLRAGRAAAAIPIFRRAIEAHAGGQQQANCYLGLGSALSDTGKKQEAVEAFRKVVELLPQDAQAQQMLALGLTDLGKRAEAAAALEKAVALAPDRLSTYQDLMALYLEQKDIKGAQGVYGRYESRRALLAQRLKTSPRAEVREDAAAALGQARDGATSKVLVAALADRSASVRMAAIRALGQQGLVAGKKPLETLLGRVRHPEERRAIKQSLEAIKHAPPAPQVLTRPGAASAPPTKAATTP